MSESALARRAATRAFAGLSVEKEVSSRESESAVCSGAVKCLVRTPSEVSESERAVHRGVD